LAGDGSLSLLRRLPSGLVPPGGAAARYDPLTCARPWPGAELPYLRYPAWADCPPDLFDMAEGLVLGQGWGPLECHDGPLSRRAAPDAELAINPLGQARGTLRLEVEPTFPGRRGHLEALDEDGRVVASAPLAGRQVVRLGLPANLGRAGLFRLRFRAPGEP